MILKSLTSYNSYFFFRYPAKALSPEEFSSVWLFQMILKNFHTDVSILASLFMVNDLFLHCEYFLENHQLFLWFLNSKSPQGRGVDVKVFTVNSNTNNSQVEENSSFRLNRMVEGEMSLSLVKKKLYQNAAKLDETKICSLSDLPWFININMLHSRDQKIQTPPHMLYRKYQVVQLDQFYIQQLVDTFHWETMKYYPHILQGTPVAYLVIGMSMTKNVGFRGKGGLIKRKLYLRGC